MESTGNFRQRDAARWLMVLGLAGALSGCGCVGAKAADEVREVAAFSHLVVKGDYVLEVREGAGRSVALSGASKDLALIKTEVRGDTLFIEKRRRTDPDRVDVVVDFETLDSLSVLGSVSGRVSGLDSRDLELLMAGSVRLDATGDCGDIVMELEGSTKLDAQELVCERVRLTIAGSGDAEVHATAELSVSIAGSGRVDVYGDPPRVVPARISGSAAVRMK